MQALRKYLCAERITQREFSRALGIHFMHLNQILRGIKRPSPKLALKIEQATGGKVTRMELLYPDEKDVA